MKTPMPDVIQFESQPYVRAKSSLVDTRTNVLMAGDIFVVFNRHGDFRTMASTEQGLFYKESRHLSTWVLRLAQDYPLLLSSNVTVDNTLFSADLTNPKMQLSDRKELRRGLLHVSRSRFVWANSCYEKVEIRNYSLEALAIEVVLEFGRFR